MRKCGPVSSPYRDRRFTYRGRLCAKIRVLPLPSMTSRHAESGFPIEPVYGPADLPADLEERLGEPGTFPYTRGVYPTMYTSRPWTMRQYAGFGTASESNARYRQ